MTSILDFLSDSQLRALRNIQHSRATASIKALMTRGLIERGETGKVRLSRNGKLALRELEQRDEMRPVFKAGQRVEFVNWRISREEWITEVHAGVVISSNAYGVNIVDEHGILRTGVNHYRVFKVHEPLTEQPAPAEHPAIVALAPFAAIAREARKRDPDTPGDRTWMSMNDIRITWSDLDRAIEAVTEGQG